MNLPAAAHAGLPHSTRSQARQLERRSSQAGLFQPSPAMDRDTAKQPGLRSPSMGSLRPSLISPVAPVPTLSVQQINAPAEPSTMWLHPLQRHHVRETHKALIDSHEITGRKLINQYEVIEELGRGMHGKVKLARHITTGENVAIKIIPRFSKKRRLGKVMVAPQDKTKKEIAILKKIRHDNVVALLEVIDDPELKKIYMVLEHVELGEIVWRKKGLPSICHFERRRIERESQGERITIEEERYYQILEHRAALTEVRRAKQQSLQLNDYMWSLEHGGSAGDSSPSTRSRVQSRDDLARLQSTGLSSSLGITAEVSRDASRTPSRAQSIRSAAQSAAATADLDLTPQLLDSAFSRTSAARNSDHHADGPRSFCSQSGSVLMDRLSDKSVVVDDSAFRGRSPSMAESLFSHMSSVDLNPHHEDPFADDYSYVPCLTIEQARSTFRDTVLGLEYLHYQGVVHRDIKPANLLWTRDHRVKISDFGVSYFGRPIREGEPVELVAESEALDFDDDLELAKTVGTPAFFAPELCYTDAGPEREALKVSEQIDVWSLGVTLFCLIFARIPFLAEDEYQMFSKIAHQEVYIPHRRLRPVDPLTAPTSISLYKSQDPTGLYRDDSERSYEDIDPQLHDLLSQMLIKDPEQRIKLRDIKRHPWVIHGIANSSRWLEETDPARPSSGRRIQVDEREMTDAVVPLRFLDRARSVVRKTVDKLIAPLTDRENRSRRRTASSAASSEVGLDSNPAAVAAASSLSSTLWSLEMRRPSFRGEEQPPSEASSSATEHQLTSESIPTSPGAEIGYDPLATMLASTILEGQQRHRSQSRPEHIGGSHRLETPRFPTHVRSDSMAVETGGDDIEGQQQQGHPITMNRSWTERVNYPWLFTNLLPLPRSPRLGSHSITTTPFGDSSLNVPPTATPTLLQFPRNEGLGREGIDESMRSRSVDRSLSSPIDQRTGAGVVLTPVVGRGSSLRARRPRPMRSVDLGRTYNGVAAATRPPASDSFHASCHDYESHLRSDSNVRRHWFHANPGDFENRQVRSSASFGATPLTGRLAPAGHEEVDSWHSPRWSPSNARRHIRLGLGDGQPLHHLASPALPVNDPVFERSHLPSQDAIDRSSHSSRSTTSSFVDLDALPPAFSETSSPSSESEINEGSMENFKSDPSLPALLRCASSVLTDPDEEMLLQPGLFGRSVTMFATTDSLTPPALPKESNAEFPLNDSLEDISAQGVMPVGYAAGGAEDQYTRPTTPISSSSSSCAAVFAADGDDDSGSDSDGGLVMAPLSRSRRPTDASLRPVDITHRRRNTMTSTGSNETAKRVVVSGHGSSHTIAS